MSQEEIQQKYLELQILEQQIGQLQQQAQVLQHQLHELSALKETIGQISQVKENTETLIPLGSGVYVKGEITNTKDLLMNVGANTITEKSAKDSEKIVEEQIAHVQGLLEQLSGDLEQATTTAQKLQSEIQQTMAAAQK